MQKINIQLAKNEQGQVAIEFILTFVFALGIVFLFISQVLNMTDGFLVHYANFMASRTYLVSDNSSFNDSSVYSNAESEATSVFEKYPLSSFGVTAEFSVNKPLPVGSSLHVFTGTTATFKKKLSNFSVIGGDSLATLATESFLGKEPYRSSCYKMVCKAVTGELNGCSNQDMDVTLYDNGC